MPINIWVPSKFQPAPELIVTKYNSDFDSTKRNLIKGDERNKLDESRFHSLFSFSTLQLFTFLFTFCSLRHSFVLLIKASPSKQTDTYTLTQFNATTTYPKTQRRNILSRTLKEGPCWFVLFGRMSDKAHFEWVTAESVVLADRWLVNVKPEFD